MSFALIPQEWTPFLFNPQLPLLRVQLSTLLLLNSACLPLCTLENQEMFSLRKNPEKFQSWQLKTSPPKLDPLDQMELKFGRMLGEDPKLTLAKIMARKSHPDATHLEIEKTFEKKKRKSSDSKIEEVPFDVEEEKRSVSSVGGLNLVRPVTRKGVKVEADKKPSEGQDKKPTQPVANVVENSHRSVPNVLLRKPSIYDDVESEKSSRLSIRPNLSLRMGKEPQKERFSDITLLKKPEPLKMVPDLEGENGHSGGSKAEDGRETGNSNLDPALLRMPEQLETNFISDRADESSGGYANRSNDVNSITDGNLNNTNSYAEIAAKGNLNQALESRVTNSFEENESATGLQPSDLWSSGKSSDSSEPSATKLAESDPGFSLDASLLGKPKRMDTSVVTTSKISKEEVMPVNPESNGNALDLENFLSSPIKKIKVTVVLADRKSRRLIFSTKPKEKEELIEKKRNLMARLSVGDVVKCCIKKITYFGIFVEVDEVPALIHQTEVSWDATLDPASYFKIGQIMEAKVHQLDFSLERIFLSLKEITPDPLIEALEAVVGGHDSLDGKLEAAQADSEWAEVESLIKELQQGDGVQSVSKGRYFLSPGLAPTFQVYMASMFENQYKLLARSGNRAQEVIVETSLGKEEMKSIILTCTNRVQ
ncbi:uncharacterized protein LOC113781505 isoform X3 [Coffea eugenioides]|uniref:uncharacterized protein LOC113781505 isoform X3 n=1 Tax=Coffea eugenioides TaxID=49369 RepID=UPI000F60F5EB|nr:uncharacterized protein LOC113781505 isoform X3 [Coffea eugenioides]